MSSNNFNSYGHYYDILNSDKNYHKEVKYIQKIISLFLKKKKKLKILELGSGTGIHGNLLGKYGHKVHGIEISKEMINRSRFTKNFFCKKGDITKIKIDKKFDAVLALFHVICYQTQNNKINLVFQNASKHLKKDGLFIFDFWYSPAVNYQKPEPRIKFISNKKFKIIRICQPKNYIKKKIVDVHYNFYINDIINKSLLNFKETHSMRYFTDSEINILAKKNSFKVLDMHEFLSRKTISRDTWGVSAILKKV